MTLIILIKVKNADKLYGFLAKKGIIIRNRSKQLLCDNCLRISVGTKAQNNTLLKALMLYERPNISWLKNLI